MAFLLVFSIEKKGKYNSQIIWTIEEQTNQEELKQVFPLSPLLYPPPKSKRAKKNRKEKALYLSPFFATIFSNLNSWFSDRKKKPKPRQKSFWSWVGSTRSQQAVKGWGRPAGGCGRVLSGRRTWEAVSILQQKAWEERRLSMNGAQNGLENRGNGPSQWKAEKVPFLLLPSLGSTAPPSCLTPSPAHLIGLREKASCCNPICLLLIHILLSLPRAWQWGWFFSCQKFGVSHWIFPRWASEKCQFTSKLTSLTNSQKVFFPQQGREIILFSRSRQYKLGPLLGWSALKRQTPLWFYT